MGGGNDVVGVMPLCNIEGLRQDGPTMRIARSKMFVRPHTADEIRGQSAGRGGCLLLHQITIGE